MLTEGDIKPGKKKRLKTSGGKKVSKKGKRK